MDHANKPEDRKLGDEWMDWDGAQVRSETRAGKRLFFLLSGLSILLLGVVGAGAWYLVTPRLMQWHPAAPTVLLAGMLALVLALAAALAALALCLVLHRPIPRELHWLLRRFLVLTTTRVQRMGRRVAVDRDRLAHSFIRVHNALERCSRARLEPSHLLVLLPRCLDRERLGEARRICEEMGVKVAVVAGGELARKRILEHRPQAVIGVACERDLQSGVQDVAGRIQVIGIPNTRPSGPCKDTVFPLEDLRESILFLTGRTAG